jgi:hypothetical protein
MTVESLRERNLSGDEQLSSDEIDILLSLEEENARRGNFVLIFPDLEAF